MSNTDFKLQEDYLQMTIPERWEFMGKLAIAAQHGYFSECSEVINRATRDGLYEVVKPSFANNEQIKDLDNPIGNTLNY